MAAPVFSFQAKPDCSISPRTAGYTFFNCRWTNQLVAWDLHKCWSTHIWAYLFLHDGLVLAPPLTVKDARWTAAALKVGILKLIPSPASDLCLRRNLMRAASQAVSQLAQVVLWKWLASCVPLRDSRSLGQLRLTWQCIVFSSVTTVRTLWGICNAVFVTLCHTQPRLIPDNRLMTFVCIIRIIIWDYFSRTGPYIFWSKSDMNLKLFMKIDDTMNYRFLRQQYEIWLAIYRDICNVTSYPKFDYIFRSEIATALKICVHIYQFNWKRIFCQL
jgi:hypothetical protein